MKTISIGHYVGTMGNVVLEQQTFIKKLLNTLQLLQPQSKEFTNQLNQLKAEYEESINNQSFESNESLAEFDSVTSQIQKDLESIHIQLRVLKSANASSRKGTGQPDLTAIEKNKKLKQSFKEYKAESTLQLTDIKTDLSKLKNELKNSNEMLTSIQANLQASRDEFDSFRTRIPTEDENEEMNSQVNDMQVELEAIKTVLEVMHQGTATTEDLERIKKSHTRSVNILKNSMQNVRDEINNIKLLKQGKIPPNVLTLVEELDQSVNSLQDDIEGVKKDAEDKSSILTKAQQDLVSLMSEMEKLKANPIEIDTSSLPINERMNRIEEAVNTLSLGQERADNNYNAQKAFLKYFKEEFATDIVERVSDLEKRMDELPSKDANSAEEQRKQNEEEYQHLDQKITQMIQDLETSNIQERSISTNAEKPDFPHTVEELRSFQQALRAQAQDDEQSIYRYIEPSNLPLVVQSMDQLLNEMYTEIYQIRDNLTNEISELKQASSPQTIKCLKHELANMKNRLNQMETVSRGVDLNQSECMQWPVLRSPGKKKEPSPFVEGLKTKIEDLVQDMNDAEGQEDDDINQIKPTMGEAQDKLNNMLSICNEIIEHEEEDQVEQITPEKMWEVLNELKGKVNSIEEKELIKTRDIQIEEEEEVDEVKEAIKELRSTSESLRNEIKQLKEMNETQEALEQIGQKMSSLAEQINEISGHQSETENTVNAHATRIREQADEIQEKIRQIEELEQTLNDFISTHHENDDQSIANMKAELGELKDQLTNIHQAHEEHGNTVSSQISDIHQKLKEFEEGAFFKSSPRANPIVQQLQKQISDLIKQMEDSQLQDQEDTTGELRPTFSQAQEQLETVQKTLDEILAQENERLMMESPSELVKNVQNLNNRVRELEESLQQRGQNIEPLQQSFSEEEAVPSAFNTQTRAINLTDENEKPSEQVYELMNRMQKLERQVSKLNKQYQDATELINKRHNSLKKVKAAVNENVTNRLDKIEDDLNHHISDHPISQDIQVAVPPDSYVKSKPNPVIEQLNQQIEELVQKIQTEELENLAATELNESGSQLKPELDQLKDQLTKLQETLRRLQEQQIYVPAAESLQGISDTISALQDKVNNQSKMIRELKDQADIKNNESVGQLKEDMKLLKKQVKEALQNEENISNDVQDQLLPINQKIETLERHIEILRGNAPENNFQESNIPLVERSVSDIYNSGSPSKKEGGKMNSIEALKTSIEQLVEKIDDDKLNEEEDATGEFRNNLGQARKDLETLQTTINSLLRRANDPSFLNGVNDEIRKLQNRVARLESGRPAVQTRDVQFALPNDDELNQLRENVEKLNSENEELKHEINSLKYEVKQLRNRAPVQEEDNNNQLFNNDENNEIPVDSLKQEVEELRNQLRILSEQENNHESKVEQMQDQINQLVRDNTSGFFNSGQQLKRKPSKAVMDIKDQVDDVLDKMNNPSIIEETNDSEELKPSMDQAHEDLEKLQLTLTNILSQPDKDTTVMTPEGFYKLVQENQAEIRAVAENGEAVNKNLIQLTETVRCIKHEMKKLRSELSEIKEEWMCITDQTSPEERKASPLVESLTEQIDRLVEDLNKPDMQNETSNNEDLEERRTQAQTHLARLREALEKAKEAQKEPLTFTPTSLLEAIKDLQQKVAYLEFQDGQKLVQTREIHIEEEEEADDENRIPPIKGFPEVHRNPVIEEINDKIESLVKTLHHPDMESNDTNGEIQPEASSTENELRLLRKSLEFLQRQQEEMDSLSPENLYKAICNLQVEVIKFEDAISSFKCIKHEVKKLRNIELNNTNEQLKKLKMKSKDVKKRLNSHLEENQRIIDEINTPRKKKANPAIEAVKREIETLNEKMNDPNFTEEEGNNGPNSGELTSRKQQAQQHLDLLSDTLTKLLEQEEPAVLNMDTLHQMIHDMYTKIALLEVQNEQTAKQNSEEMQNIFRSIKEEVNHIKEENKLGEIEEKISQLEQTVESMEEVNSSFASFTPLMKTVSKKPNQRAEELKNQIDMLVSQMDDPSLLEDDTQGELKPAMDKSKDELQVLRDLLQHFNDEEGFTPAVFMDLTTGLDSRIKALEEDKENQIQTREITLEQEQKVDEVCKQIEDIQNRLGEVESQPSQIIAGFNTFKKRPINPSMEALKVRIDELMNQMNDPELQNEDENKNSKLKPSISKAETELRQLQETLKRLMEQEEPVAITPQSLHELIHQLQAQVTRLDVVTSQDIEESEEKFNTISNDLATFNESVQTIIQNQNKLIEQYNSFKTRFDNLEEQVSLKENELNDKIDTINGSIEDIQSHVTEIENQPTQYLSGFPESQTLSRPVNPVIRGIQNRIDELVQQMNDPTLQDEENKSNEELQQNMANAEAELQQLKGQLKHLMEQEEPIVVTPEDLLEMVHNLQAKVASLEASEDMRNVHAQKERTLSSITQSQAQLIETFNDLKTNLDEFKNQLHDTNASGEEMDRNVNDLCQKVEETQNKIAEFEGLPTPLQVNGFTTSQNNSTPIIQAIQKRIDELVKEMKHPSLQNEDNEANTRLKPSMTKAENELLRLQETLKRLEEEDQITPNKLHGMIQGIEGKVDEHIENHPSPEPAWSVIPREVSPAVQDLKGIVDEICKNMQVAENDDENETTSQLKPNIENAQGDLLALQQKLDEYLQEQEKPAVLTPDRIYNMILDLQSELAKVRKYQIKQQRAQAKAEAEKAAIKERNVNLDVEFEEEEEEDDEVEPHNTKRNNNNNLENEIAQLRSSIEDIKSEMNHLHHIQQQQQQLPSPTQEYNNFKQTYANGIPKTEDELVSYINRLEKIAEGFDRNIITAQTEIKKVGQIKNQLKEESGFVKSIQDQIKEMSHSISCLEHEVKILKSNGAQEPSIKSRDVSLIVDDENKKGGSRRRRRNNEPTEEEQVKALQNRLSSLESQMDSFKLQYSDFNKPQDENARANQEAVQALNTSINRFIERNIESDDDEEVERPQPDIEKSQIKLRALKGTIDDMLYQQEQKELATITPRSLNADIIDVRKHVEKTENDINEINDRIDTLDDNQESFNIFKNEDLPNQLSQIKNEIALLQESKEQHQNELSRLNQSIEDLNEEDKKKAEAINQLNNEIDQLKEALAERDQSISLLRDNVNNHSEQIEVINTSIQQHIEQNEQKFNEVEQRISSVSTNLNELNNKVDDQFNTIKQSVSTITNEIDEIKEQNYQKFREVKQSISTLTNNFDELKNTVDQNHEQSNQKFREVEQNLTKLTCVVEEIKEQTAQQINELKCTVMENQQQNAKQFERINQSVSTITSYVDELKNTVEQNQAQNAQKFNQLEQNIQLVTGVLNDLKNTVQTNYAQIEQQINELSSIVQKNQEQSEQKFNNVEQNISSVSNNLEELKNKVDEQLNEVRENLSSVATDIDEIKSQAAQHQEQNTQEFREIKDEISSLKQNLSNEISSVKQSLDDEISSVKQNMNNEISSVNENLTNEIANLKIALHKQEEGNSMINSHSKNIEYIQKVLSKHDKNLKALIEKEKGVEDFIQQNDPVSKDDFQKLEMKYDKLIEQIHSNISVIANGQQSQHESFKKELNNLSQNNSELQSEASLGTGHHKEGVDELTKKVAKIFKHVKSQDDKINKLRTDVDGLLNA